ncbi:potassium-transporting ATPase subunit C [Flavobacterium rivuli WB 3.3-2 = DSM 21788]|uniref:Potassium-transporting ATPase KdpC subunit n=1 Tax=Flavobacterium rivuli WB 3.3-2 = DSM 21788 TaxID=1121895 RepID=A0A0A2M0I6_9FLAO|nr:K(+)-transporting ATPase subunit C [Flavobacterium rivuli]KGO86142.1 potassium-transporting ATPase subunit C [Flavobacterium rivuli WB 3.3-2 = DSM 21788]
MKNTFLQAIKLSLACLILLSGIYTLLIFGIAQAAPNHGKGEVVSANGKTYYANIGQSFTSDKYFNSRPSAVAYNAAGSGGSNKGPSNSEYLAEVQKRIDTILILNPDMKRSAIPADLVTASGSGLDPHISVLAAKFQIKRIAKARNIKVNQLETLIENHTEKALLGLFGPEKINVLELNIALDKLK